MYHTSGRTVLVSPGMEPPPCTCYEPSPPPHYYERTLYQHDDPGCCSLGATSRRRPQINQFAKIGCGAANCIGGVLCGTAYCLAATLEIVAACIGGVFNTCSGKRRQREIGEPYSWKNYDVGNYEYDMVVYRRPRRNWFQKLFDC